MFCFCLEQSEQRQTAHQSQLSLFVAVSNHNSHLRTVHVYVHVDCIHFLSDTISFARWNSFLRRESPLMRFVFLLLFPALVFPRDATRRGEITLLKIFTSKTFNVNTRDRMKTWAKLGKVGNFRSKGFYNFITYTSLKRVHFAVFVLRLAVNVKSRNFECERLRRPYVFVFLA